MEQIYASSKCIAESIIVNKYKYCDVCMGELLANLEVVGLSLAEQYELYTELLSWSDGDKFVRLESK